VRTRFAWQLGEWPFLVLGETGQVNGEKCSDYYYSYETGALSSVSSMFFPGRAREGAARKLLLRLNGFPATGC